uniref:DUF2851 family protein n=1 Tax=Gelidibacter sp. TaxID=2018083 RepID=UPI004049F1D1
MQEEFLHYVWQHKKIATSELSTTHKEVLTVLSVGLPNSNSGPDFFNAQVRIGNQLWAGNVEIHIKSSDWFVHHHETDTAYDNVILHVVYEHDTEIFRKDNTVIPTLELKKYISAELLGQYQKLISNKNKWINCENDIASVSEFTIENWLERLYIERLERKSESVETLLKTSKNDWEAVLFKMLAKNFGLKVNGEAFLSLANSIDFSIIRKSQSKPELLEALFFGQAGWLEDEVQEPYYLNLVKDYTFLKQKFSLSNMSVVSPQFFRLRPPNFPTIRLSQLAMLYHQHQNLFSKIIEADTIDTLYKLFDVNTSDFWKTHFTFSKSSKSSTKKLTQPFIDLIIINTILPIKFAYAKHQGKFNHESILEIACQISNEQNSIIEKFNSIKPMATTSMQSQALIQLKTNYCDKNKCLQCSIGNALVNN